MHPLRVNRGQELVMREFSLLSLMKLSSKGTQRRSKAVIGVCTKSIELFGVLDSVELCCDTFFLVTQTRSSLSGSIDGNASSILMTAIVPPSSSLSNCPWQKCVIRQQLTKIVQTSIPELLSKRVEGTVSPHHFHNESSILFSNHLIQRTQQIQAHQMETRQMHANQMVTSHCRLCHRVNWQSHCLRRSYVHQVGAHVFAKKTQNNITTSVCSQCPQLERADSSSVFTCHDRASLLMLTSETAKVRFGHRRPNWVLYYID